MKSSIIIPTYKITDYFLEALESVRGQDFSLNDYEIIIVDNASLATPELAAFHHPDGIPAVRYVHEPQNGLHRARHAGAQAARGDILVYLDDDVICPPGWLRAMVEPYQEQRVAMVAGKVKLLFESEPPPWLSQFHYILSALDWGEGARAVPPYGSPVGCNMSIRKSVLFSVGGFNPDAFGDRRLLRWRGDGECGLARKVHNAGLLVWYASEAWLWHRVPAARMTPEYICWRSAIGGIENAYADFRYNQRTVPGLAFQGARSALFYLYHVIQARLQMRNEVRRMGHLSAASRYQHRAYQYFRQSISKDLRYHTLKYGYLL